MVAMAARRSSASSFVYAFAVSTGVECLMIFCVVASGTPERAAFVLRLVRARA